MTDTGERDPERTIRRLSPGGFLDRLVEQEAELFEHLRGPGHGLTEEAAVRVVLTEFASLAKRLLPDPYAAPQPTEETRK